MVLWRYINRGCPGRVTLDDQDRVISANRRQSHETDQTKFEADKVIETLKRRAKEETKHIPCKTYQETIQVISTNEEIYTVPGGITH